eukprot:2999079-Rhodomonas_salina.1
MSVPRTTPIRQVSTSHSAFLPMSMPVRLRQYHEKRLFATTSTTNSPCSPASLPRLAPVHWPLRRFAPACFCTAPLTPAPGPALPPAPCSSPRHGSHNSSLFFPAVDNQM